MSKKTYRAQENFWSRSYNAMPFTYTILCDFLLTRNRTSSCPSDGSVAYCSRKEFFL